jgi:uncharacterized lipoprotein YddW (UPF0748 family)
VNVFPAWKQTVPPPEGSAQLWNTHRDWFMQNRAGETMWPQDWWTYWYTFLDPGVPEVKKHLHDVCLEIVKGYPIAGLHFDYIRYPGEVGDWAYNAKSVARFKQHYKDYENVSPETYPVQWAEWKRTQITEIVHSIHRDAHRHNPEILITAAVIHDWPRGHNDYAQDARTWLSRGILDATFPMLYRYRPEDLGYVLRDHLANAHGGWALPGLQAGRASTENLLRLVEISRELGARGLAIFAYRGLFRRHEPGAKARALLAGPFASRVPVPRRS